MNKIFAYFLLGCVVAWLIFSYVPATRAFLPAIQFGQGWQPGLFGLGAVMAIGFLVIQVWLVFTTVRSLRRRRATSATGPNAPAHRPGLNLSAEAFWTALPILMTVFLIIAGYRIWDAQ